MDYIIKEKQKNQKGNNYFTSETEKAIIKYNNTEDPIIKNGLYEKYIHFPFFKLTQNIIHTFKFYNTDVENLEDLQHEVMVNLLNKMYKFDPKHNINKKLCNILDKFNIKYDINFKDYININPNDNLRDVMQEYINNLKITNHEVLDELNSIKPPKAYSYFGTIVKNYLIIKDQKVYNTKINTLEINNVRDVLDGTNNLPPHYNLSRLIENDESMEGDDVSFEGYKYRDKLDLFINNFVEYCEKNLDNIFVKEEDKLIGKSVLEIFRNRNNLEILNKRAVYIYLREMTNQDTSKITKANNILRKVFKEKFNYYLEYGYFK